MHGTDAYWSLGPAELLAKFDASADGLSADEAALRLKRFGPNSVEDQARLTPLRLLLRQFESPLVLILIFGAVVSLGLRQWVDSSIILAVVFGSTLLGFAQEYRASAAIAQLKSRLALTARILRGGVVSSEPTTSIVRGDVIVLSAGNLVPADGVILEATDFLVSEAALTGESFPVEKQAGPTPADAPLTGRLNCVFLGASVRSGTAKVLVVKTGRDTAFGAVVARLRVRPPETEFARGVRHFGYLLLRVMIVMVLFVLVVNQLLHRPFIESLLFAVALAVGLSPELLPAIVSVTLSAGARAMAKEGVIVRRLEAIEDLGGMDILCTDKTGTLTEGAIALTDAVDAQGRSSDEVKRLGYLNAAFETGIENPLDAAIVSAGTTAGLTTDGFSKVDEIPYDFMRKRLTIVVAPADAPGTCRILTKGAVDNVLAVCTTAVRDGAVVPLDAAMRETLQALVEEKGSQGVRALGMATRDLAARKTYGRDDEADMRFIGFLLFYDPPKPEALHTIRDLAAIGVRIKMISGDNRHVCAHVAEGVGLDGRAILTGGELDQMKDEALWRRAEQADVFAEIDPQQKERIVRALQRSGHAVGFLGDGINDAPALHAADVGISVENAVDVARESADIILLRRDLDVLRKGVEDGRRTFANTLKYICITTSANFGNMVSMALATPLLPFLPLVAKQILLNNFLSDLPAMTISTDKVDPERLASAQRWNIGEVQRFMIVFGLISTVFDLITFGVLLRLFHAGEKEFQTVWFVVSVLTELAVLLVLRTRRSVFKSAPSRLLMIATAATALVACLAPFAGPVATIFGFSPPSWRLFGASALIVLAYVATTEAAKLWFYRQAPAPRRRPAAA